MLSDSLSDFQSFLLDGKSLSSALTELRADVIHYSKSDLGYGKFIINALLGGISQLRKATKKDKPEMLLRLLTMSELVQRVCGFDMGSDEELEEGLQLAFNGTRYKLKTATTEELKLIGAAPLDETFAREMPTYNAAQVSAIQKIQTNAVQKIEIKVLPLPLIAARNNVISISGRPYKSA